MANKMIELKSAWLEFDCADESHDKEIHNTFDAPKDTQKENSSDEEWCKSREKKPRYSKKYNYTTADRLRMRVPEAPDNFIELVREKKCTNCNNILGTITAALSHYNCTKHQVQLASNYLPDGLYNLPLSKEEIRELGNVPGECDEIEEPMPKRMMFRDLIKKFDIKEDVRKLDLDYCRLCDSSLSNKLAALQHYAGKRHKKEAEHRAAAFEMSANLHCDICNVAGSSSSSMEEHVIGKKHHLKLKIHIDRLNRGAVVPSMSKRGFCDFNNVEREEANPLDASKFIKEEEPVQSIVGPFVDVIQPQVPVHPIATPYVNHTDPQTLNMYSGPGMLPESVYRAPHAVYGAVTQNFGMSTHSPFVMADYGTPEERVQPAFTDGGTYYPQGPTTNFSRNRSLNVPITFEHASGRSSSQSFGPTKFQYLRKQPFNTFSA